MARLRELYAPLESIERLFEGQVSLFQRFYNCVEFVEQELHTLFGRVLAPFR